MDFRQQDNVRLEGNFAVLWSSRLARLVSLEVWREMIGNAVVDDSLPRVSAGDNKMEALRQLDGLIEQMRGR